MKPWRVVVAVTALCAGTSIATAQTTATQTTAEQLAARIDAVRNGTVRLSFDAREGVCGNGSSWSRHRPGTVMSFGNATQDIEAVCDHGPVRVVVVRDGGVTTDLRVYVGARWKADTNALDLGSVSAAIAGRWLLSMVEQSDPRPARGAMMAATITDSVASTPANRATRTTQCRAASTGVVFAVRLCR